MAYQYIDIIILTHVASRRIGSHHNSSLKASTRTDINVNSRVQCCTLSHRNGIDWKAAQQVCRLSIQSELSCSHSHDNTTNIADNNFINECFNAVLCTGLKSSTVLSIGELASNVHVHSTGWARSWSRCLNWWRRRWKDDNIGICGQTIEVRNGQGKVKENKQTDSKSLYIPSS